MHAPFVTFLLVMLATPAIADGELESLLTAADKARLEAFDKTVEAAMDEAATGNPNDLAVLQSVLDGNPLPLASGYDPTGKWSCRTLKLGGNLPLVAYPHFKCTITDDGAGWTLKKLTGSQRTEGRFFTESDTRLTYVGAGHVAGEAPRSYGDDPLHNQVAVVERLGENRILLFFPAPQFESKLDILVLER